MKLAVCLFGLTGGSDGSDGKGKQLNPETAFINYKNNLFHGHEVDFFTHSWSIEKQQDIIDLYNPKRYLFEERIDFSEINYKKYKIDHIDTYAALYRKFPGKLGETMLTVEARLSHSRWLSAKRSINLMNDYKMENNINYQMIIQMRYDLFFHSKINLNKDFLDKFICVPRPHDEFEAIDDLLFISTYEQALKFSTLYDNVLNYSIRMPFAAKQHIDSFGIKPNYLISKKDISLQRYVINYNQPPLIRRIIYKVINKIAKIYHRSKSKLLNILKTM